ncbi:unnamed protein product, partial [Leptidea sinapis]
MASRLFIKKPKHLLAKIANEIAPCAFCQREVDDELLYGKLYSFGDIHCHYFCVLLSCCLLQKGDDVDGLFGFLYPDVLVEIERKMFLLPPGGSLTGISYCQQHAPKQTINAEIMEKVKERRKKLRAGLHEGDETQRGSWNRTRSRRSTNGIYLVDGVSVCVPPEETTMLRTGHQVLVLHSKTPQLCMKIKDKSDLIVPKQEPEKPFEYQNMNNTIAAITPVVLTEEFLEKNLPIISPNKHINTVNIQNNSVMEVSENNEIVNINFKINETPKGKMSFKFSPAKDVTDKHDIDLDLETFKSQYLSEIVGVAKENKGFIEDPRDKKKRKRKADTEESDKKKRKITRNLKNQSTEKVETKRKKPMAANGCENNIKEKRAKLKKNKKVVVEFKKPKKKPKKRCGTELSIRNKGIRVNIRWVKERLKLKITKANENKNLKQCVLQFSQERPRNIVMAPADVSPLKRKYTKKDKLCDNLVQTSLHSFFKVTE